MITGPIIAEIAALVGDPARATMVSALLDGRSLTASELARAARDKFGGDSLGDFVAAHRAYVQRIDWAPR